MVTYNEIMKPTIKTFFMIILSSLSIIGAIVGVGFVSGREIVSFFYDYGEIALFLCLLSFLIETVCLYYNLKPTCSNTQVYKKLEYDVKNCKSGNFCVKNICNIAINNTKHDIDITKTNGDYNKYFSNYNSGFFDKFYNYTLGFFELLSSSAMIAGIFQLLSGVKSINVIILVMFEIVALVFVYIFAFVLPGVITKLSGYTSLILFVMMTVNIVINYVMIKSNTTIYLSFESTNVFGGIFSCVFYVSMNMLSCAGVIKDIRHKCNSKKAALFVSVLSSFLLHLLIFLCLSLYYSSSSVVAYSMPLVILSINAGKGFYYIYYICLLICSLVSLTCVCYSGKHYFNGVLNMNKYSIGILYLLLSFLFSLLGFNFLVSKIYPFVGMGYIVLTIISKAVLICKKRKI